MENIIYTDADLNAFLVANEEKTGNTISIIIECDISADQALTITSGDISTTEALISGTKNRVEVPLMLWNFGNDTVITLSKSGSEIGTLTIHFPAAVDTDAAINETDTDNEFTLQGSESVQEQIVTLQESVERVSAQTLAYILPSAVDQSSIADGDSNTVETFEFEAGAEDVRVAFFTCIQFLATTTVTAADAYEDLNITITISVDGVAEASILQTYRDGRQTLTINQLIENLSKGNHSMTVDIAAAGGSVSVMQIIAAYLLTAKSTSGGSVQTYEVMSNGEFAPGVLADGLDQSKMTKEANIAGIENTVVKSKKATSPWTMPLISELSAWFLSEYCLATMMYYSPGFFYMENGYYTRDFYQSLGNGDTNFYIPVKRIRGFNQLSYEAKMLQRGDSTPDDDYNIVRVGCGAIVNGQFQSSASAYMRNVSDWQTFTFDISALPHIDYIVFYSSTGKPAYRNIKLLKV